MALPLIAADAPHHAPCECGEGANEFIRIHFCDCIYSVKDGFSFALGMASIAIWLVAQVPQLVENHKNKKAEALSVWFLVDWLMGDTCNLIGCLATGDQLATQVYTAIYFVFADMVVLLQFMYYNALDSRDRHDRRRLLQASAAQRHQEDAHLGPYEPLSAAPEEDPAPPGPRGEGGGSSSGGTATLLGLTGLAFVAVAATQLTGGDPSARPEHLGRALQGAGAEGPGLLNGSLWHDRPNWEREAGMFIGYCSSVFYVKGRLSQIIRNFRRKSTEGLSALMFINAILGNITYGAAIFLRVTGLPDVMAKLPWIIGSLGTVLLDVTILMQELASRVALEKPSPSAQAAFASGSQ